MFARKLLVVAIDREKSRRIGGLKRAREPLRTAADHSTRD